MNQNRIKIDMWSVGYCRPMIGNCHAVLSYVVHIVTPDGKLNIYNNAVYVGNGYTKKRADIVSVIAVLKTIEEQYHSTSDVILHVPSSQIRKATVRKPSGEWVAKNVDYPHLIDKMRESLAAYSNIEVVQSAFGERHLKDCIKQAKKVMNERN